MHYREESESKTIQVPEVIEVTTPALIRDFIRFPHRLYKQYPYWIPPINIDLKLKLNKNSNPFLQYGKVKLFAALEPTGKITGRIAAIINPVHNSLYNDSTGFFGLFESKNDQKTANALFDKVEGYLLDNGITEFMGPVNFTTNDECGILIENFDDSPMIMCNYSPPYYDKLLLNYGFTKEVDLLTYEGLTEHIYPQKYYEVYKRIASNPLISFRTFSKKNLTEDALIIKNLYNESFKQVWGFVPLNDDETLNMAKTFLKFYDKELIWICYYKNKPAGFILGLPDINQVLKKLNGRLFPFGILRFYLTKNKIKTLRVLALGVPEEFRHLGFEILLIDKIHSHMKNAGYIKSELSVVMENNLNMRKVLEHLGFIVKKRYRLYKVSIK
jgi:ribosomal protein S18 acetylase RimI-like enzyme